MYSEYDSLTSRRKITQAAVKINQLGLSSVFPFYLSGWLVGWLHFMAYQPL